MGIAILATSGCQTQGAWVGEWVGTRPLLTQQREDPTAQTLARVRLTINADGTFKLVEAGFDKEGEVVFRDKTATLTIQRMLGRPIEQLGPDIQGQGGTRTLRLEPERKMTFIRGEGFPDIVLQRREDVKDEE